MNDTANTQQFTAFRNDICDENKKKDYPMCPRCDKGCPYWPLYDTCIYSKVRLSYAVIDLSVVKYKQLVKKLAQEFSPGCLCYTLAKHQ